MITFKTKPFNKLSTLELYEIISLREEVFVVEQNCPYLDADGKDIRGWHVMGYDKKGKIIAYARILPIGISYKNFVSLGRIVTSFSERKKGIGKKLMKFTLKETLRLFGSKFIKISAQTYLIRFYESFGFQVTGDEYLEDGIPHVSMILKSSIAI